MHYWVRDRWQPASSVCANTVTANVVAIDQVFTYNRYGSFNPAGMIYALRRDVVPIDPAAALGPGNARLRPDKRPRPIVLRMNVGDCIRINFTNLLAPSREAIPEPPSVPHHAEGVAGEDAPVTRGASIHVNGLQYLNIGSDGAAVGFNPSLLVLPGRSATYLYYADREGPFFMHSMAAIAGGEGDGGSTVLGLFGAVVVEPPGSRWYRSQVTHEQIAAATTGRNADGTPIVDFETLDAQGAPILRMTDGQNEIVHSDLNAIITGYRSTEVGTPSAVDEGSFREFVAIFHDELKTTHQFRELEEDEAFHGVRDGFGINYGASGLGGPFLANRAKFGPAKDCIECRLEEFFLSSWPNGDPALNVEVDGDGKATRALYPDDPSNVHHSYLRDPVRIRNIHAGPKETHVFHLHAHQWLHTPSSDRSTYMDSQSIGPGTTYTYDINYGGGGNRNFTVGDAIFHCHLYPHFAQGMWSLWRTHDVFEDGGPGRNLPDAEIAGGTPNPALIPLPDRGMAPMPSPGPRTFTLANGREVRWPAIPGFPFFIASLEGHRPPQAPFDIDHDGGLPRHLITSVPEDGVVYGRRGIADVEIFKANIKLLPEGGTPPEKAAMAFHAGELPGASPFVTRYGFPAAAYPAFTPSGAVDRFVVNGLPPKPGAPYADPCPPGAGERVYRAAYVQADVVVNRAGWHDPQSRLAVLEEDAQATIEGTRPAEPFFFRANSGECVVFHASNLIPDVLEEDDFQVFTPTDILGQHIHLVKFDVTSSDGAANGWNYSDGTFASEEVRARIDAANALGGAFEADGRLGEEGDRVALSPKSHPRLGWAPLGTQITVQRWWADPTLDARGRDKTLQTVFSHDHFAPSSHQQHGLYAGLIIEPASSQWRDPETGELLGTRDDGGPTSWRADILAGADSFREFALAFADFALLYDADGRPVNPPTFMEAPLPLAIVHPEDEVSPEVISAGDPGGMVVNYRQEPIPLRIGEEDGAGGFRVKDGEAGQMHNVFRSPIHGDPMTPVMRAYGGDRVKVRLIHGAQEEQHAFTMSGLKWLHEENDPDSGFQSAQTIGVSEHQEFVTQVPPIKDWFETADYMWRSAGTDDVWNGMWGLLRTYRVERSDLKPLPNNPALGRDVHLHPCPDEAPRRSYVVHAITARGNLPGDRLVYNERFGLYDPDAILFVRDEHLADVRAGRRRPEPLILRAAAGECVKVTLFNHLPGVPPKTPHWSYNPPIIDGFNTNQVPSSSHVSLRPQLVYVDANVSDGASVGNNLVQTVAPGESRVYRWFAGDYVLTAGRHRRVPLLLSSGTTGNSLIDLLGGLPLGTELPGLRIRPRPVELGAINLLDMGDMVNHGMHGAVGALIIEPERSWWEVDPAMEAQATVFYQDRDGRKRRFREMVLVLQDEVALHSDRPEFQCGDVELNCGTALRNNGGADDAEDSGHKAFNYRTEPLWARLGLAPQDTDAHRPGVPGFHGSELSDILSSWVHGDPETPVFTARAGEEVRLRLLHPSGHPRQHAFTLHGAEWPSHAAAEGSGSTVLGFNPQPYVIGTQGSVTASTAWNIRPLFGAGGRFQVPGDYLYRDQASFQFPDGLWGILRVVP
ncbi:MAG: copper oxidase [Myxococcales bacterium]|nr:copper oxidase [Myxococcales bacterium]